MALKILNLNNVVIDLSLDYKTLPVRKIRQYHNGFSRDYGNTQAVVSDFCFTMTGLLLSPESTSISNPNYRHNFVGRINEKVHPILSPESYTGIKFDLESISKK